jgi:ureidoacrylate peracid hydrolase
MKTALIVIDPQNIYTDSQSDLYCKDSKATIARINELISLFDSKGLPTVFIRHVHKADGSDLGRMFDYAGDKDPEFDFVEGTSSVEYDSRLIIPKSASHFVKKRYSAFSNDNFTKHLGDLGADRLAICGFMTNFCCDSTCRDAHGLDYYVDFILDATGTPGTDNLSEKQVREAVGELLGSGYCVVYSKNDYLKKMESAS